MIPTVQCGTLVALALSIACSNADRPTAPGPIPTSSAAPIVVYPPVFPPRTGPAQTYVFSGPLEYRVSYFTEASQYVLYDNGAFALQYLIRRGELVGAYRVEDGRIIFTITGGEDAIGTLKGDVLEVRYSERMQHSDYENAAYKRSQ